MAKSSTTPIQVALIWKMGDLTPKVIAARGSQKLYPKVLAHVLPTWDEGQMGSVPRSSREAVEQYFRMSTDTLDVCDTTL